MKLLHTSDWHVGKQIRGNSRADEHRAVLGEIVQIAERESVDVVVVVGDLWDSAAPSPESEEIVYSTLLGFAKTGAQVAVVAGNHDNARRLRALSPLLSQCGVRVLSEPTAPNEGGLHTFTTAEGTPVRLAMLPFVSQRGIVKADQLMSGEAFDHALAYAQRLAQMISMLSESFDAESANVLMAHAYVLGGATGGGERAAHIVQDYAVQAPSFPATAGYVALGHLHRPQSIAGPTAMHYCGSPLQLDFGEVDQRKQVNVVEITPGVPAKVTAHELASGRPLRSYQGTVDQLRSMVVDDDAWLRLVVKEPQRAGLGQQVRDLFGSRLIDVRIESLADASKRENSTRKGRSPHELFAEYMDREGVTDTRVSALFGALLDDDAAEVVS